MKALIEHQNSKYPNDIKLKELLSELEESICLLPPKTHTTLTQPLMDLNMDSTPDLDYVNMSLNKNNISKKKKSLTRKEKLDKIKLKLEQSFIIRDVMELNLPLPKNAKDCLRNIIKLDRNIRTYGNKQLREYASLGETISKLKAFDPVNYIQSLKQNNINYSISYLNYLIRFSKLCLTYHKILECSVSIYYIKLILN